MKSKNVFPTGEFARLCLTTRETLLHYDRKGILKPRHVAENGYRLYGAEQYFDFDMISLLKDAGCSLEEIRRCREAGGGYIPFLQERLVRLREEKKRLEDRIAMLSRMVDMAEEAENAPFDTLFFEQRKAERALLHAVEPERMLRHASLVECYSESLRAWAEKGASAGLPLGSVIPQEAALRGFFRPSYVFRRATQGERDDTRRIPAGTYACMFHKGDLESHARAFARMMEEVKARRLTPAGDVYALTQMSYVLWEDNGETHIARYAVRVEEAPRP